MILVIESVRNYIKDLDFRFTVYLDKINIINYQKIISLEDDKILLLGGNKKITIRGKNLTLSKLLDEEVLILGEITKIEVDHE